MHKIITFVLAESPQPQKGEAVRVSSIKSAPHYFEATVPSQFILGQEKAVLDNREVEINIKSYQPDVLLVEAITCVESIFDDGTLKTKDGLLKLCYEYIKKHRGPAEGLSEEYNLYIISGFTGDPEQFLKYEEKIASLLKSEKLVLDKQEIQHTLSYQLKYEKGDLTILDWDGALIFDAQPKDPGEDLELCELANYQLLKHRMLDRELDNQSQKVLQLIQTIQPSVVSLTDLYI